MGELLIDLMIGLRMDFFDALGGAKNYQFHVSDIHAWGMQIYTFM